MAALGSHARARVDAAGAVGGAVLCRAPCWGLRAGGSSSSGRVDHPRLRNSRAPVLISRSAPWWPRRVLFSVPLSACSDTIAQVFLLAPLLVTIACIIRAAKPADEAMPALGDGICRRRASWWLRGVRHRLQRDRVLGGRENDVLSSGA